MGELHTGKVVAVKEQGPPDQPGTYAESVDR
jgi:hypothetical protein